MAKPAAIYGALNHSLLFIYQMLEQLQANHEFRISVLDPKKKFRKGDIYLAADFLAVQHFTKKLEGRRGVLILCEAPVALAEITGLKYLDGAPIAGAGYQFKLQKLTSARLEPVITSLKERPTIKIKRQKLEVLPDLINRERSGKFLDKLNTLLYYGLSTREQHVVRKEVLKYLYGRGKLAQLQTFLVEIFPVSSKSKEYIDTLVNYLESKPGLALRAATQEIGKTIKANKNPITKTIAKRHDTHPDELVYLTKLYRTKPTKHPFV